MAKAYFKNKSKVITELVNESEIRTPGINPKVVKHVTTDRTLVQVFRELFHSS